MARVFGTSNSVLPNIEFGVDQNGCAILKFYDNNGKLKGDLGPDGWRTIGGVQMVDIKLALITQNASPGWEDVRYDIGNPTPRIYYKYQTDSPDMNSGRIYTSNKIDLHGPTGVVAVDGWYVTSFGTPKTTYLTSEPYGIVGNMIIYPAQVAARTIYRITDGRLTGDYINVYYIDITSR